jgi:hypothetical protein
MSIFPLALARFTSSRFATALAMSLLDSGGVKTNKAFNWIVLLSTEKYSEDQKKVGIE